MFFFLMTDEQYLTSDMHSFLAMYHNLHSQAKEAQSIQSKVELYSKLNHHAYYYTTYT